MWFLSYFKVLWFHIGTQGGTFLNQRENPFSRARRTRQRQQENDDTSSSSSYNTSSSDSERPMLDTFDYEGNLSIGGVFGGPVFMVSDTHSINGKRDFQYHYFSTLKGFNSIVCMLDLVRSINA